MNHAADPRGPIEENEPMTLMILTPPPAVTTPPTSPWEALIEARELDREFQNLTFHTRESAMQAHDRLMTGLRHCDPARVTEPQLRGRVWALARDGAELVRLRRCINVLMAKAVELGWRPDRVRLGASTRAIFETRA